MFCCQLCTNCYFVFWIICNCKTWNPGLVLLYINTKKRTVLIKEETNNLVNFLIFFSSIFFGPPPPEQTHYTVLTRSRNSYISNPPITQNNKQQTKQQSNHAPWSHMYNINHPDHDVVHVKFHLYSKYDIYNNYLYHSYPIFKTKQV